MRYIMKEYQEDVFEGFGVPVRLKSPDDFLIIKESLERIGISPKGSNKLFQSCHLYHRQGQYALVNFKELLVLDGKINNITEQDIGRRNKIAELLQEWGLLEIIYPESVKSPTCSINQIKIISFKDKGNYEQIQKYHFGNKV